MLKLLFQDFLLRPNLCTNRFVGDLDAETSKIFCDFLWKTFGVGQDNQTTLVGTIHFLSSIQLAVIVNRISGVVIRGEGFRYSLSFPKCFLLGCKGHSNIG